MKNITKALFTCGIVLAFSGGAYAQYDVSVSAITSPAPGSTINTVLSFPIDITFRNNSANAIPGSEGVDVHFFANGTPITGSPVANFSLPTGGLAAGADIGFNGLTFRYNIPPSSGTVRICYMVTMDNFTDPNPANDSMCANYTLEPGTTVEMAMSNLGIVIPSVAPNGTIGGGGQTIDEMTVTITNNGNFTYPEGFALPYNLYVQGNAPISTFGVLSAPLTPGSSTTRQITNTSIIPALPASGPFSLCGSIVITNDIDPNNNETCTEYVSAVGIDELTEENATKIHFNNSSKTLDVFFNEKTNGNVNLVITSTSGQVFRNMNMNVKGEKESIDLSGIANGLYVMSIINENGNIETQKFVVQ